MQRKQYIIAAFPRGTGFKFISVDNDSALYPRYSVDRNDAMVFDSHKAALAFIDGIDDSTTYAFAVHAR